MCRGNDGHISRFHSCLLILNFLSHVGEGVDGQVVNEDSSIAEVICSRADSTSKCHDTNFVSLFHFQSVFMFSVVLAPVITILWVIARWHHDQALNNFIFITFSLHGVGSTIVMILVHKPYREFASYCFLYCQKNQKEAKRIPLKGIPSVIL